MHLTDSHSTGNACFCRNAVKSASICFVSAPEEQPLLHLVLLQGKLIVLCMEEDLRLSARFGAQYMACCTYVCLPQTL